MNNTVSKSRLEREIKARKRAEQILEAKALELYNTSKKLEETNEVLQLLLNEKDTQLKGVFQNINDAYLLIDLEGNILKMNEVSESFFGIKLGNKNNVFNFLHKDDYKHAIESFRLLIDKGVFSDFNTKIINSKNEIKWVNINASVIYSSDNQPIAAQGIIRDITLQREKQQIVDLVNNTAKSILGKEDIEEIAWFIVNNIANYLVIQDCVIYLIDKENNSLEQIAAFGNKQEDKTVKNKLYLPLKKGIVGRVARNGIGEIVQDTRKDKDYIVDDKIRRSELTVPIIHNNEVIGIIDAEHENTNYFSKEHLKTIENIASLVALQLQSAINLKERKKVEARNKDLLQRLSKSNDELKEYAHIVSHDLKSPLRSISALAYWIKTDNLKHFNQETLDHFSDLEITLEKMDNLISDVLNFSKLEAKLSEDEDVDINLLISDIVKVLYIPENITVKVKNKLPIVKGEKIKYQQLFQNLISNAVKFNDKPNGLITIDVIDENSFYKFNISDNGIGIDEKHHEKIFKIFQSLKTAKDSTGIGLSIVKKIVNLYQGEIWLTSELNKGTTFYFTIKK